MTSNNKFELSDKEFQEAMEALPSYNYDLALEIENLTSLSQVPENKWEEFVSFYKEYKTPKKKRFKKKIKEFWKYIPFIALILILIFVLPKQYLYVIGSVAKVNGLLFFSGKIWFRVFKEKKLNPILRIFNNYFLAWTSYNNYKGKTNRVEFWHFYLSNLLILFFIRYFAGYWVSDLPHVFFEVNTSLKILASQYSLASNVVVGIPLAIRRLRDIGKKNKILWFVLCSIPIYGLFIFAKPSLKSEKK